MNKSYSVITNALVVNQSKQILISRRSFSETHEPGKWTIPGGKLENSSNENEAFNVLEKTLAKEVMEEVGVEIEDTIQLVCNNIFQRSTGQIVLALVFLAEYKSGKPKPLEDTIDVKWINLNQIDQYDFAPNVQKYLQLGFEKI